MKLDISDITFIIPVRLDSIDRLVNLKAIVEFILENFETNIHVLEADCQNSGLISALLSPKIATSFIEDYDPIFHRTYYINKMAIDCKTPYIAVWDSDVLTSVKQIFDAAELLRKNKADFVYPYEKRFLDTSFILRNYYLKKRCINILERHHLKMKELYPPNPVGGAFFANAKSYLESGLENESFYGWGIEDAERIYRWEILGYKILRVPGQLYHLTHSRGINSRFHNKGQQTQKLAELERIKSMTAEELTQKILSWKKSTL